MENGKNRVVILRRCAVAAIIVLAVGAAYEVAWVFTGQYGAVGALLYLAACLLSGVLIPVRFILSSKAAPSHRAAGLSLYLMALWAIWTMVWGGLALDLLDEYELERWQTTLLFYGCTIGLPLLVAVSIRALLARLNHVPCAPAASLTRPSNCLTDQEEPGRSQSETSSRRS